MKDRHLSPGINPIDPDEDNSDRHEPRTEPDMAGAEGQFVPAMPPYYLDRWQLYLDGIDAGWLPAQPSYHCWCEDCSQAGWKGDKDAHEPELLATSTAEVRGFVKLHDGHDMTLTMEYKQEFADLEQRARTILLQNAIFCRLWVASMSDHAVRELAFVGPKLFKHIRKQIPYTGPPEIDGSPKTWERCPTCQGTGLRLSDAALAAVAQRVSDLDAADVAERDAPAPPPTAEESLMRITTAIEEINSRIAVLEKDRRVGLTTPRILMSVDDAAKAVGVRYSVIWDAVMEGDLPFVRMVKGMPMVRSEALEEWLKWSETRMEREPEPYVYVVPPERLCRKCGEREYHYRSAQLKLCQECHQQLKQERIDEKERKRAERLSRKKPSDQP